MRVVGGGALATPTVIRLSMPISMRARLAGVSCAATARPISSPVGAVWGRPAQMGPQAAPMTPGFVRGHCRPGGLVEGWVEYQTQGGGFIVCLAPELSLSVFGACIPVVS